MGFYEVLDQVVQLLRQRGRVTYRALKREFQLDDAFLEDLKDELIKAQRLAVDEQGDVLVWTGVVDPAPALGAPAPPPTPRGESSERHAAVVTASPTPAHPAEAERRQPYESHAVQYWRLIHRAIAWYTAQTTAWISVHADVDDRCEACPGGRRRSFIHGDPLPALSGGPWG